MHRIVVSVSVLLLVGATTMGAQKKKMSEQDIVFNALLYAKSLHCTFDDGVAWESDVGERKNAKWGVEITFDSINRPESIARMIGNQGASDVSLLRTMGTHFIETTGGGG